MTAVGEILTAFFEGELMRILLLITAFLLTTACGQGQAQRNSAAAQPTPVPAAATPHSDETECKICDFDFAAYKGELKKTEIQGLLLALNDEYMAWATYARINEDHNSPRPFINIQQAEAKHIERLKELFVKYGLPVPENKWVGKTPAFGTVAEACKAGVDAEVANVELYKKIFATTEREDILVIYRALQRASNENHLPAFQRCGGGRGGR